MRVVVTGGQGLIGGVIAASLANHCKVFSLDRRSSSVATAGVHIVATDLTKPDTVSIIKALNPEVIIHCAARIPRLSTDEESEIYLNNLKIDDNILSATNALACPLIYMSSTIVYGHKDNHLNVSEGNPVIPVSKYALQKIESETLIRDKVSNFVILRINAPYGENMTNQTVLTHFIDNALQNKILRYHGTGVRMQDFTHVADIASLVGNIVSNRKFVRGTYNINNGNPITMLNLAQMIVRLSGSKSEIVASGEIDEQENYKASYSTTMAKNFLGWNPMISLESGISGILRNMKLK